MKKGLLLVLFPILLAGCGPTTKPAAATPVVNTPSPAPQTEQESSYVTLDVQTASMSPTIPNPCTVKVITHPFTPYRGEVVALKFPDNPSRTFVKRIIGMPGDTVEIHDGHVYINGIVLNEPYISGPTEGTYGPHTVSNGAYFVLGDNRPISDDSRYWLTPDVPLAYLIGRVSAVIAPSDKAKTVQ